MSRERAAAVAYLRRLGDIVLADALERGEHRPIIFSRNAGMWRCGHPRTEDNTVRAGKAGPRCKKCRRVIGATYRAKQKELGL